MSSGVSSQVAGLIDLIPWRVPLPALSNAGQCSVHAGEEEQHLEHQHHRRHNQTQHVARRSVPLVGRGTKKFVPAVEVAMCCAYYQGQVAQL